MNETEFSALRILVREYAGEVLNLRVLNKMLQIENEQLKAKSPPPEPVSEPA